MDQPHDPDVETYLALVRKAARPSFETLSVEEARAFYRSGRDKVNLPAIDVGPVEDRSIAGQGGSIGLRLYRPIGWQEGSDPQPAILFFHGGGWVIGDLDTHDSICRHLVDRSGLTLIAVDYRLAPEHPFPAAVEDALDAHGWLVDHAVALGIRADLIIVAGDSAGGCLSIVTALVAVDMGRPRPIAQCLFYPVTDLRGGTASYREVSDVPITATTMAWFAGHYLTHRASADDWRVSPLLSPDLAQLPATFLAVAGQDPLHDEGLQLADALRRRDVTVELRYLAGQVHGYLTLGRIIGEAERSIDACARFLSGLLA